MPNLIETIFILDNASSNAKFRFYTQFVITTEGVIATILFCIIFASLFIVRFDKGSGAYLVFLVVSSVQGFLLSVTLIFFNFLHIIRNGDFVVLACGFGTDFIPPEKFDLVFLFFINLTSYSWELIPTASILQFIALARPHISTSLRLFLAYSWPVLALFTNYFYGGAYFIPTPAYRNVLAKNAREFYDIPDTDRIYVHGFPFGRKPENGVVSAIDIVLKYAGPTYTVSYTLFLFSTVQIRRRLNSNGSRLSKKTLRMQKQFFRTQLLQGLSPLAVLSIPFVIFITVTALGNDLNKFSVVFSCSMWFAPIVQALVILSYIKATLDKQMNGSSMYSLMKTSDATPKISVPVQKLSITDTSSSPMANLIESVFIHGNATMSATVRFYVQLIVTAEGVVATILFCILFAFLFIVRFDKGSGAYRVFLTVSAIHGFMLSTMLIPLNFLHLIRNGDFVNIALGYGTDFIAPEHFNIPFLIFTNLVSYSWELVPSASVLQYIALTKPKVSLTYRLCWAYAWPVIAFIINYFTLPYFIPAPAYREVLAKNARDFYEIHDHERIYVYGFPFLPKAENGDISAIDVAIKFAAPTYSISYGLFLFNVYRIRKNLSAYGVRLSARTLRMQKRFFRTQLWQGLSPLIVLSIPFSIFFTVTILGYDLNKFSVIYSFGLWFVPIVQALVMLSYIRATLHKQMNGVVVHNLTKTSVSMPS